MLKHMITWLHLIQICRFDDENRKVVRGGSWKDVAYFLRVSSRDYEYSDTSRSYIGFRTVQDYLGSQKVKMK